MFKTHFLKICLMLLPLIGFKAQAQIPIKLHIGRQEFIPGAIMAGADEENRKPNYTYYIYIQHKDKNVKNLKRVWVEGNFYTFKLTEVPEKKMDITVFNGMTMDTINFIKKSSLYLTKIELLEPLKINLKPKNVLNNKNSEIRVYNKIINAKKMKSFVSFGKYGSITLASQNLIIIPSNVTE